MHITTLGFLVFVLAVLLAYALFPARLRYVVLLCSSALFVFAASPLGYAFILLSAMLPLMNGFFFHTAIRSTTSQSKPMLIIFST